MYGALKGKKWWNSRVTTALMVFAMFKFYFIHNEEEETLW